jgi:hypothetical protein
MVQVSVLVFAMPVLGGPPPDLGQCTRLEVQCSEDAMNYFFPGMDGLFNGEEREYIRSCGTWVIEDPNQIRLFAEVVGLGTDSGKIRLLQAPDLKVACYSGSSRIALLGVQNDFITAESGNVFFCHLMQLRTTIRDPPGIEKLRPRKDCARVMVALLGGSAQWAEDGSLRFLGQRGYPTEPGHWCDAIVEALREHMVVADVNGPPRPFLTDAMIAAMFRCPTKREHRDPSEELKKHIKEYLKPKEAVKHVDEPAREWVSDYAMNPNCEPNSPKDTVLLFEAKPGWNQHGGPELFTFDNHDPKGGCVLLNDGTVKFVRTKEELAQLRWKP